MKWSAIFFVFVSMPALANKNHCTNAAQVIFSCNIANSSKVVSLCASKKLAKDQGHLVYRFGAMKKIELQFPSKLANSLQAFRYAHYFRYQVDRTEISFTNKNVNYAVFDYYEGEEKSQYMRGVATSKTGYTEKQLLCGKNIVSNLQKLEGAIPCDTDSALTSCN